MGIPAIADYVNQDLLGGVGTTMVGRVIEQQFEVNINYPLAASLAFGLMLGLAALNRYRAAPALLCALDSHCSPQPALRALRGTVLAETTLALLVLLAVSLLGTFEPPIADE